MAVVTVIVAAVTVVGIVAVATVAETADGVEAEQPRPPVSLRPTIRRSPCHSKTTLKLTASAIWVQKAPRLFPMMAVAPVVVAAVVDVVVAAVVAVALVETKNLEIGFPHLGSLSGATL